MPAVVLLPSGPEPAPPGAEVTLAEAQRETASRLGPFWDLTATGGDSAGPIVASLRTSAPIGGGFEGLYLLRREALRDNDRVRTVTSFDGPSGTLVVDFPYEDSPIAGERLELHHLHPDLQLQLDILAALRRCYVLDTLVVSPPPGPPPPTEPALAVVQELGAPGGNGNGWVIWPNDGRNGNGNGGYALVPSTGAYLPQAPPANNGVLASMAGVTDRAAQSASGSVVDLTAQAFWLTARRQVLAVAVDGVSLQTRRYGSPGWTCYASRGHLYLAIPTGVPLDGLTVRAYRDAHGLVNGGDDPAGPTLDTDELAVPVDYVAAFAHVEAWRRHRDRLEAAAAEGRFPTQVEASAEATRVASLYADWLFQPAIERGDFPATALPGTRQSAIGLGGTGALTGAVVNINNPRD